VAVVAQNDYDIVLTVSQAFTTAGVHKELESPFRLQLSLACGTNGAIPSWELAGQRMTPDKLSEIIVIGGVESCNYKVDRFLIVA
jgi:hypothetical protein